jgi:multidrug resistance efflux pump
MPAARRRTPSATAGAFIAHRACSVSLRLSALAAAARRGAGQGVGAARYQDLAQKGYGSVQNAQQFTSQLHQKEAAVQTAAENLNQAQRQVETQKAQRLSAEATLAQTKAQLHQAQVNPRVHIQVLRQHIRMV